MSGTAQLEVGEHTGSSSLILRLPVGMLRLFKNLTFGTLACLTPFTAIIALGWFARFTKRIVDERVTDAPPGLRPSTGWIMDRTRQTKFGYWLGGLGANLKEGIRLCAALSAVTLPFTILWLGAWWAGWENSFNKGYEQYSVGPLVFLAAALFGAFILSMLPFAFCHVAFDQRLAAVFEWKRILGLVRLSGWRYVLATVSFAFFALPLLASRALPVFYQDIIPGSAEWTLDRMDAFRGQITLIKAIYVFASLCLFRYWFAKLYSRSLMMDRRHSVWMRGLLTPVWSALLLAVWGGFIFLMVVSQFMNMNWILWINHPFVLLPWMV